jgi:hypothetical protein
LAAKYAASGLVVLAINTWDEDERQLKKWAVSEQLKQRILVYGREVGELYGVGGAVPAAVWIDPAGKVVTTESGKIGQMRLEHHTKRLLGPGTSRVAAQ